ncbi:MAG: MBL fold metallo-hydrolase [Burkholderiales bacterium]|nr:MBL fold metallo-hydrolase [Burkholderiales bacterium]
MRLTFLGAAGEVTGSSFLIEHGTTRFLVDCGMFQGGREAHGKNLSALAFDARSIDFVVLTHAHIDHSGLIPRLAALGFRGPVWCTRATAALLEIMLPDSAHVQEADAAWKNRRKHRSGRFAHADLAPLYTVSQAQQCLAQLQAVEYDQPFAPAQGISVTLRDAGHILGSAIAEIIAKSQTALRKLVFSGDLGQPGRPLMRDPTRIEEADLLVVESTYGNRLHRAPQSTEEELVAAIHSAFGRGGNVVIPAFAVGRTQEVVHVLADLVRRGRLPRLTVFVDSPMAAAASAATRRFNALLDEEGQEVARWIARHKSQFNLRYTESVRDSMAINQVTGGAIIIAASGMCNAGRIVHHLAHNLPRRQAAVLITGFQALGTPGRRLVDGAKELILHGERVAVRASVHTVGGLSAHADQAALLDWLSGFRRAPRQTFVVHGEAETAAMFGDEIRARLGWKTVQVPERGASFNFD